MNKIKKVIIALIIIVICGCGCYYFMFRKNNTAATLKILDSIEGYPYKLDENSSELEKDLYYDLKEVLNKQEIDDNLYAELVSKLFIVDVFTLTNKISKYDIGGVDYVAPLEKEKFKNIMKDTLYENIESFNHGKRSQELPIVASINVVNVENTTFTFDNRELLAYDISLEWTYSKDLGYDNSAKIIVSKLDDIYYVMEYSSK